MTRKEERRLKWAQFKGKLSCSRPMLALHVLLGRPLVYRVEVRGGIVAGPRTKVVNVLVRGDLKPEAGITLQGSR